MKVGYLVETPVEHNLTGGSRSFLNLVEQLKQQDIEPYVVVSEEWALTEELRRLEIPYITSKMFRPFVGTDEKARFYRAKYYIKLIFNNRARNKAVSWFRKMGVELVHINSQFAGVVGAQVAQRLHLPYVYHLREYLDRDFGVTFYSPKLVDKYIKPANRIIAISKSIQSFYERKFSRELSLVYNGIPVNENSFIKIEERFQSENIHMVIVGRVTQAKGQQEAAKALSILVKKYGIKNLILHIVGYMGKDPYELELKRFVEENRLQDHVVFHEFTKNPFAVTKNCDIGLMCSVAEAFGRVTVEYMLASLCTVGANTGGTPEIIVDGESGLLYRQGDPSDLAEKIRWIITHRQEANVMMRRGCTRALENYTIQATAKGIRNLYEELIHR